MKTAIVWFRQDLRLDDHPALNLALAGAERVIPVYLHAPLAGGQWPMGSASRWWLHHSLKALDAELRACGSRLLIRRGASFRELAALIAETGAEAIFWNRQYEPQAIARDTEIKRVLRAEGFRVETGNAALLYEPWELKTAGGEPYKVFTPFWNALRKQGIPAPLYPRPKTLPPVAEELTGLDVEALGLLPRIPWDRDFHPCWQPGEEGASRRFDEFLGGSVSTYKERRDLPHLPATSRLSPHLHFGEISPRRVARTLAERFSEDNAGATAFLRELAWREFAHHLLFHFPATTDDPMDVRFARFPWAEGYGALLQAWRQGNTGYPLVDAGMRELWSTGWMHNRVRMVAASLLTKNLLIPWREGARWFWDTLLDADLANNSLGWQWVAGCGADAAPYFRVFNPVLQGQRFDPDGEYVRRWVPELARLPAAWLHTPWLAPPEILQTAGVRMETDYPLPIVDLRSSRERALGAYAQIKGG